MKRKITLITVFAAVLFAVTAIGASACRAVPYNENNLVSTGAITTGKTAVRLVGSECKAYTFTPANDGFYKVTRRNIDCAFLKDYTDDPGYTEDSKGTYKAFYEYITCDESDTGATEFINMKAGRTYTLYAVNPLYTADYAGESAELMNYDITGSVEITYAGRLTDYSINNTEFTFSVDRAYYADGTVKDSFTVSGIEEIEENGKTSDYLYTGFDAVFSEAGSFSECCLRENCCGIKPLEIISGAEFKEGKNTVKLSLCGVEKEFTVTCSYEADNFVSAYYGGNLTRWAERYDTLTANFRAAIRVMTGLEGIGSPRISLGFQILSEAVRVFITSVVGGLFI